MPRSAGWAVALLAAVAIHSTCNHFFLSPVFSTAFILVVLERSEKALEEWLNVGFDADTEVLEMILSGTLSASSVETYLRTLKERFCGEVVVEMPCCLRLHLERSIGATGKPAMAPFLRTSSRDLWQIYMMRDETSRSGN